MDLQKLRKQLLRERATGQIPQAEFDARMQALDEMERLENPAVSSSPQPMYQSVDRGGNQTVPRVIVPPSLAPGTVVDRFELVEFLGQGGMGQAWKAVDPNRRDDRRDGFVVLKFLTPALQHDAEALADFQTAWRRIAELHHQNICPVYELGQSPVFGCFQVMKFVPGSSLYVWHRQQAGAGGRLPLERVVQVLRPVALALDHAHRQGLIHRDIKPGNIIVDAGQSGDIRDVQVIDFGLAAEMQTVLSRTSRVSMSTSGTLAYMAPEQWQGKLQDAATDQYALAVLAHELLLGRLPFHAPNEAALGFAVVNAAFEPDASLSAPVSAALSRGLAKDRKTRFDCCADFVEALISRPARPPEPPAPASAVSPRPREAVRPRPEVREGKSAGERWSFTLGGQEYAFRWCPAGKFTMGSPKNEAGRYDDEAQVQVELTRGFWLQETPVTQGMWKSVMGTAPWQGQGCVKEGPKIAASYVSWDDAEEFCAKLQGLGQESGVLTSSQRIVLPSEARWEYACRAGTTTAYSFGNDAGKLGEYAWYDGNAWYKGEQYAHEVGLKKANGWGLQDLHGNVWEWCADCYGEKLPGGRDPVVTAGSSRVVRGGSFDNAPRGVRCANRGDCDPTYRFFSLGFRIVVES